MYIWWLYDLHLYTVVDMVSYCIYHEHYVLSSILLWSGISEVASRKFDIYNLLVWSTYTAMNVTVYGFL